MYGSKLSSIEKVYKDFRSHLILETYDIFRLANVATVLNLLDEINLKCFKITLEVKSILTLKCVLRPLQSVSFCVAL